MKTYEFNSKFSAVNWLLNLWPFLIEKESIKPVFSVCLGCKEDGKWNSWVRWRESDDTSLFHNGIFYFRFMLPFWIGLHIRWAGSNPEKREFMQTGFGWKGNGRIGILFRIQSDYSGAAGVSGHNYGQSTGFDCGNK